MAWLATTWSWPSRASAPPRRTVATITESAGSIRSAGTPAGGASAAAGAAGGAGTRVGAQADNARPASVRTSAAREAFIAGSLGVAGQPGVDGGQALVLHLDAVADHGRRRLGVAARAGRQVGLGVGVQLVDGGGIGGPRSQAGEVAAARSGVDFFVDLVQVGQGEIEGQLRVRLGHAGEHGGAVGFTRFGRHGEI